VLKFGGSVLRNESDLARCINEAYRWIRDGYRVVAVVSAFEGQTDTLLSRAEAICPAGPADAHALLLATGELQSAALLGLAAARAGVPARVLGPHALALRTNNQGIDADPSSIDGARLLAELATHPLVIAPGFVGVDAANNFTLLGRGGSDLTAIVIAKELGARCRLVKDVDGLYEFDPASTKAGSRPNRFSSASWDDALLLDGGIVQHKAVRFAKERALAFEVGTFARDDVSVIGGSPARWYAASEIAPTLRVSILGCGVVGGGVAQQLASTDSSLALSRILVRENSAALPIAHALCRTSPHNARVTHSIENAIDNADIVIELVGGISPAREWIELALQQEKHVITANKALIAAHGKSLQALAAKKGVTLQYSAAVGGGVPMIEAVRRVAHGAGVRRIECVVNGTCNYVLNSVASGASFEDAVTQAKRLGYAEADPTRDLDGTDSFDKLIVLSREAWGTDSDLAALTQTGLLTQEFRTLQSSLRPGARIRLLAYAERTSTGITGGVRPQEVLAPTPGSDSKASSFFDLPGASNRLCITSNDGKIITVDGAGAGRWPTTQSVLADALALTRLVRSSKGVPAHA
jgi:homoserine dehydrogenase